MTFLPIVSRELRVASRRRGTYWSRCFTTALATIAGFFIYLINRDDAPYEVALVMFGVISWGAFVYCLFSGVRSTADCLSEEKREGTLGLLFLTDLKGYDVVSGKLVATSLNAFYGLIAIFPVLAIPLLMGGVTNGEFWRMALILANTFFFSLAVGMFMSSVTQSPRWAMGLTLVFLLASSLGLFLAAELIPAITSSHNLHLLSWLCNPGFPMVLADDQIYKTEFKNFWRSVCIIHAAAWIFLALASFIVPRSWQDRPAGSSRGRISQNWREWNFGVGAIRTAFRRRLLTINPFFWLAGRARLKPVIVWTALGLLAGLWCWGAIENGRGWTDVAVYIPTAFILNCMLKLWITSEAGRRLGEDRKLGSLELILSTPLTVRDILRGQLLALRRQFLGPTIAVLLIEFIFLLATLKDAGHSADDIPFYVALWAATSVMLVVDMVVLSVVAMWVGLSAKNPNRATGITLVRVAVLPDIIFFFVMICATFFGSQVNGGDPSWKFDLAAWLLPGLAADAYFGLRAWHRLRSEFREVAAQRFDARPTLFQRLLKRGRQIPTHVS
jgi:ABC-type Na+ efflux pump permease subunit